MTNIIVLADPASSSSSSTSSCSLSAEEALSSSDSQTDVSPSTSPTKEVYANLEVNRTPCEGGEDDIGYEPRNTQTRRRQIRTYSISYTPQTTRSPPPKPHLWPTILSSTPSPIDALSSPLSHRVSHNPTNTPCPTPRNPTQTRLTSPITSTHRPPSTIRRHNRPRSIDLTHLLNYTYTWQPNTPSKSPTPTLVGLGIGLPSAPPAEEQPKLRLRPAIPISSPSPIDALPSRLFDLALGAGTASPRSPVARKALVNCARRASTASVVTPRYGNVAPATPIDDGATLPSSVSMTFQTTTLSSDAEH